MADEVIPFDKPRRRSYTKVTSQTGDGDTEVISFRATKSMFRRLDEIVQSGNDVDIKTKSDAMNDALFRWLEWYLEKNQTDVPGIHDRFLLDRIQFYYSARERELVLMKEAFERARQESNDGLFNALLYNMMRFKTELEADPIASPRQLHECNQMITDIKNRMGVS